MVGWHHGLNGHEFEQAQGDGEGQGSLVCFSPWSHGELDMTAKLNNIKCRIHVCKTSTHLNLGWKCCCSVTVMSDFL